jgi:dGTPase
MTRLNWHSLLSEVKRKDLHDKAENNGTKLDRSETERDYDRILFASPTRRMADKTQVFPLDVNDSVRTRLTHSHEVANLARSIGMTLAFKYSNEVFGDQCDELEVKRRVPSMLAAVGLAHDLGNPPFGHQGEKSIQSWFKNMTVKQRLFLKNSKFSHHDFLKFDGNPHTFRLLTKLQILNDDYGLNLTCGTLAALVKYPSLASSGAQGGYKKFGVFESEKAIIGEVWEQTGLREGLRHPFAHIMEACDDIAYAVLDAEDIVKKGFASFYDLIDHIKPLADEGDEMASWVKDKALKKNATFRNEALSSSELNEISMQMFRVFAISKLIEAVVNCFVENIDKIMSGELLDDFHLIEESSANDFCNLLKQFDQKHGFSNKSVLKLELLGHNNLVKTMDMLWVAMASPNESSFKKYARTFISDNYRRVYDRSEMETDYKNCQLLCDSVAGMTDKHLIRVCKDLTPLFENERA